MHTVRLTVSEVGFRMKLQKQVDNGKQPDVTAGSKEKSGRRRFMCGAGAIVPVVLTVGSRSALATTTCFSPSARASINSMQSRPDRTMDGFCSGGSPGYWKNAFANHHDSLARDNQFSSIFGSFVGKSMEDVTNMQGNNNHKALARHLAAAWCNLTRGFVSENVLSVSDLQHMWAGRLSYYSPTPGVKWYDTEMIAYLTSTMDRVA